MVDAGGEADDPSASDPNSDTRLRRAVSWRDLTLDRPDVVAFYANAGGSLRGFPARDAWQATSQCWIAKPWTGFQPPEQVLRVAGVARKILQRGTAPPLHPDSEARLYQALGLADRAKPSRLPGDVGLELRGAPSADEVAAALPWHGDPAQPDADLSYDSEAEARFLTEWVPANLGEVAARYFIPQASLDQLAYAGGLDVLGSRRVDFLVAPPGADAFVIEIDGDQHEAAQTVDEDRDAILGKLGMDTVRISTEEL